jgi:hypothetical protein
MSYPAENIPSSNAQPNIMSEKPHRGFLSNLTHHNDHHAAPSAAPITSKPGSQAGTGPGVVAGTGYLVESHNTHTHPHSHTHGLAPTGAGAAGSNAIAPGAGAGPSAGMGAAGTQYDSNHHHGGASSEKRGFATGFSLVRWLRYVASTAGIPTQNNGMG